MRRYLLTRVVFIVVLLPFILAFAPHDGGDSGKSIGNSAPPGIGGEGPWDAWNMLLVGRLDLSQIGAVGANVLGNDCWGWTDPLSGKEYAICGLTNATSFIDISDPTDPKYLGKLMTQTGNSSWRDMKVYENHVFIVSDSNGAHGMQIFDLTQLRTADPANPSSFSNSAFYDANEDLASAHNIAINEDSGYAYIVGSGEASGGLHVVDISNPLIPVTAGNFGGDGYTHDCQVVSYNGPDSDYAGSEIAFCCNEDTVTIVDVTDKSAMTQISRNPYAEDGYTHQGWLSEDHRYFYMGDELDENQIGCPTRTHIFDCLDLDNPVYKGFYSSPLNTIDHNLYVKENRLYCGNYSSGLRILEQDAQDPAILQEVAYFDTYSLNNGVNFDGVWSAYPYFRSGNVLINDRQGGMFLAKLSPVSIEFPNGRPELIDPAGVVEFLVQVSDFAGTLAPNTATLHVDIGDGNGFEQYLMNPLGDGLFEAKFPPSTCAREIKYYLSAAGTNGDVYCRPSTAPTQPFVSWSARSITQTFYENFESASGWSVSGDALDGQWELGVPVGGGDRGDPANDYDGSGQCFLTDNADGNSDVDDGTTILLSPTLDLTTAPDEEALLSYARWYSNSNGGDPANDIMVVDISNDGGESWVNLETVGPSGSEVSGGWIKTTFRVSDFVTPSSDIRLRFEVSDLNGGSVIEAGLDGLEVRMVKCAQPIFPGGSKFLDGIVANGTLSDLNFSDEQYLEIDPSPTGNPRKQAVDVVLLATSPVTNPTALNFRIGGFMSGGPMGDVTQTIRFKNEITKTYETVDVRYVSDTPELIEVSPGGDVSRFVNPISGDVTARVSWRSPAFAGGTYFWSLNMDQMIWVLSD